MSSGNEIIIQVLRKLGASDDKLIITKTSELLRRLEGKSFAAGPKFGDYAKTVLAIDIASQLIGTQIDVKTAIKVSGLGKTEYARNKRNFESILDLSQTVDIPKICIQLRLSHVQKLAEQMFDEFKQMFIERNGNESDLSHPQYAAMSVFQACKHEQIKLNKLNMTKLLEFSHLKNQQWDALDKSWVKISTHIKEQKKVEKKIGDENHHANNNDKSNGHTDNIRSNTVENNRQDNYEEFKSKLLQEAFKNGCDKKEIEYLRLHILMKVLNLNQDEIANVRELFDVYLKTICTTKEQALSAKYAALAIYNVMKGHPDFDFDLLNEYTKMKKSEWTNFVQENSSILSTDQTDTMMESVFHFELKDFKQVEKLICSK